MMATKSTAQLARDNGLAPAGAIGRVGKLMMGAAQLYAVYSLIRYWSFFTSNRAMEESLLWYLAPLSFGLVSWSVNLGFNRKWGKRPFFVALGIAALALGADFVFYGAWFGPPLAWSLVLVSLYVHGHMGFSHVLAALIATPGCEMRAIVHLASMISGGKASLCICPGFWTRLDEWEARRRSPVGA